MRITHAMAAPALLTAALLCGCASTTVTTTPPAPAPLCQQPPQQLNAAVLWGTHWRADQKDVAAREAAAAQGLARFFEHSGCYARTELRRLDSTQQADVQAALRSVVPPAATPVPERWLVIVVRELGPVVRLLSSAALVEGGTEVVLDVDEYTAPDAAPRHLAVHWRHGGPGVVKGVASLPDDMVAALAAVLQPAAGRL